MLPEKTAHTGNTKDCKLWFILAITMLLIVYRFVSLV